MAYVVQSESLTTIVRSAREALRVRNELLAMGNPSVAFFDLDMRPISFEALSAVASDNASSRGHWLNDAGR